ncbi:signal peptide peptidase-like 2B isoform X1 [Lethenteron reissneri]|uniref:signal peptide peptidase-like 2B isoform X1 n=1 Tax=Lethenteron reissneri TaxID=7753 RepID=UPI002AB5FEC7|nr:signal peptide peptidase-like 2B isoform X1 [Lethenteron reissneri]
MPGSRETSAVWATSIDKVHPARGGARVQSPAPSGRALVCAEMALLRLVSDSHTYCTLYNPRWAELPQDPTKATPHQLADGAPTPLCLPGDVPPGGFAGAVALATRGNCSFYHKARLAAVHGASALLVLSHRPLVSPGGNETEYEEVAIPVALMGEEDARHMLQARRDGEQQVLLFAPRESRLDYNMMLIYVMAVGTVAGASYWAGVSEMKTSSSSSAAPTSGVGGIGGAAQAGEDISPKMVALFVATSTIMLTMLYFFYDYLVYVIIAVFCLASSLGLYSCLAPLVSRSPCGSYRVPRALTPCMQEPPPVRLAVLALFCVATAVVWVVFRNKDSWAWVLQDMLGIAFCTYMLRVLRMPSFKACTLLLVMLFVYDIFFVFITPYIMPNGQSIMVEVASGPSDSSSKEKLPMVLKVPRLAPSELSVCSQPFSLLGFGDILVPGVLVVYCHRFDVHTNSSHIYFVTSTIAYGLGLLVTFVALVLTRMGQPALLYLVPCMVLTCTAVAAGKRQLPAFWRGSIVRKESLDLTDGEDTSRLGAARDDVEGAAVPIRNPEAPAASANPEP